VTSREGRHQGVKMLLVPIIQICKTHKSMRVLSIALSPNRGNRLRWEEVLKVVNKLRQVIKTCIIYTNRGPKLHSSDTTTRASLTISAAALALKATSPRLATSNSPPTPRLLTAK